MLENDEIKKKKKNNVNNVWLGGKWVISDEGIVCNNSRMRGLILT